VNADGVGQEGLLVAQDFELDPPRPAVAVLLQQVASEQRDADRVVGREAPGRVGQDHVTVQVEVVQQRPPLLVHQPLPADRHGDHLAPAGVQRLLHQLVRRVLARPDEQPVADFEITNAEDVHGTPLYGVGTAENKPRNVVNCYDFGRRAALIDSCPKRN
jgi:hypothetical protein